MIAIILLAMLILMILALMPSFERMGFLLPFILGGVLLIYLMGEMMGLNG